MKQISQAKFYPKKDCLIWQNSFNILPSLFRRNFAIDSIAASVVILARSILILMSDEEPCI